MSTSPGICWFRQDLRLHDNPALLAAIDCGEVLPVFILDDDNAGNWKCGSAARLWLHHSLNALQKSLEGRLSIHRGRAEDIIPRLCRDHQSTRVFWNRCYEPWRIERDKEIKKRLQEQSIDAQSFNGSLLWEPWQIMKKDGTPYKVFTPFYKSARTNANATPAVPLPVPDNIPLMRKDSDGLTVDDLKLRPDHPWCEKIERHWRIGEENAQIVLEEFIEAKIDHYNHGRDFPAEKGTSRLSPHLHFGEISPRQVWEQASEVGFDDNIEVFKSELGWREFSYYLLYHFPRMPYDNLKSKFDRFPWWLNEQWLKRWKQGMTGVPFVDAGMRELWQTGHMHNRVRMIVASFLVKNLLIDWRHGAAWFWDCLVDADLASNSASWQWVAGCGTDAAPFFRIFNPVTQGQKFDPDGIYTRHFVPELKELPSKYLFSPWNAPQTTLEQAGVRLGDSYPCPLVDIQQSRQKALDALKKVSSSS
ncbi:MAG: deoxyribodipyrimidine photo-lyase [Desulfobulbaceae bacterium]|nr:MAG: deoxyribodipyrimidine photo-lyase [Desulfobulbaceae bacterium]